MAFSKYETYTCASSQACDIVAKDNDLASTIWFTTPALNEDLLKRIIRIQLETTSRDQGPLNGSVAEAGSWSWFDLVVLQSPDAKVPKIKPGIEFTPLWQSHVNPLGSVDYTTQSGIAFDRSHDIFASLEPGNAIGVRVCSRFPERANYAAKGELELRLSDHAHELPEIDDARKQRLHEMAIFKGKLEMLLDVYLDAITKTGDDPAYSLTRKMILDGPVRADLAVAEDNSPLQLLSIDGGGVRGISSLTILGEIMYKLTGSYDAKPCDYFHMIAGTSTGGLIAIMLGRLQLTVPECIKAYTDLSAKIFDSPTKSGDLLQKGYLYKGTSVENAIKGFLKDKGLDENLSMYDPNGKCRVFVVAGEAKAANHTPEHIRTYKSRLPDKLFDVPIWQAGRATSAAPSFFPSITINGTELVDGGIRYNNPAPLVLAEAYSEFGLDRLSRTSCFLTLGTGMRPDTDMTKPTNLPDDANWITAILKGVPKLVAIASATSSLLTDCENVHKRCRKLFPEDDIYWRFNLGVKNAEGQYEDQMGLDDYINMGKLVTLTKEWLAEPVQMTRLDKAKSKLVHV